MQTPKRHSSAPSRPGRLALAAAATLAVLAAVAAPAARAELAARVPLPVAKLTLAQKSPIFAITAAYPRTGDPRIDADLLGTVGRIADNFRREATAAHADPHEPVYTLDVSYRIARNDGEVFAVEFDDEWDLNGAHPNLEIVTADYLRAGSWRVYLPELFDGRPALARISGLARAALDKRLLAPGAYPNSDPADIARGTAPAWSNFAAFLLLPGRIELVFPPYAVAPYAAGPQRVDIPLAALTDVMRKDPRAPLASFDCARAATEDERAVCSDAILARLDRAVAEMWAGMVRDDNDPAHKARLIAEQVAWLNRRENACRPAHGEGRVACLTALYQARLEALRAEEE